MSQPTTNTNSPQEATIVSVLDVPSQDPKRAGKMDALITYRIDPLHSFTISIPADDLTPDKVATAVRQDFQKRKAYINAKISL